jgi:dimethylargininase
MHPTSLAVTPAAYAPVAPALTLAGDTRSVRQQADEEWSRVFVAVTRGVSPNIERCELTHLEREPIDVGLASEQHRQYEECLASLGCVLNALPSEPDLPDSVFVEDTAVIVKELALLTRPGASSRRGEIPGIELVLRDYRSLARVSPPGTLDGGDVLAFGRDIYVGLSARTNEEGLRQARSAFEPLGYTVTGVPVRGCLHLKSAVGQVSPDTLLINRLWVDAAAFGDRKFIDVDPTEPGAAGALLIGDTVLYPAAFTRTRDRLTGAGIMTETVELSELAKAEAGVTCCSLVFEE